MKGTDRELILGLDFGTSSLKAALFDKDGVIAAQGSAPYPLIRPRAGWVEQNPQDWWQAACAVVRVLAGQAKDRRIAAIGITAQMCGVVATDERGEALLPCPIWLDTRSETIARDLMDGWPKINGYGLLPTLRWLRIANGAPNLSGKDPLSKFLWLQRHRPDVWPRVHKLLDAKDYLVTRMTGAMQTSFDCAHLTWLMDIRTRQWSGELLARTGLARRLLPEIASATETAGHLCTKAASELGLNSGIPISVGLGDVCAAAFGSGSPQRRSLHLNIGTSLWFGTEIDRPRVDPFHNIGTLLAADGESHLLIATQENAGSCIAWSAETLGFEEGDFAGMEKTASDAQPDLTAPLFLPWLTGERVPVNDTKLRGGFWNKKPDSGKHVLMRSVYEGVALNARWAMGYFDRLAGRKGATLRLVGGGARSDLWCQVFADVLNRPLERMDTPAMAGPRGAAMTASVACGWYPNIAAASAMVRAERTFAPANGALYDMRFKQFLDAYRRVRSGNRSQT